MIALCVGVALAGVAWLAVCRVAYIRGTWCRCGNRKRSGSAMCKLCEMAEV